MPVKFGSSSTHFIGGNLTVTGTSTLNILSVTGSTTYSGSNTFSGTSTFSGNVSGVVKEYTSSMSSSATTTACDFTNTSGVTKVVIGAAVVDRGSASSLGAVAWVSGTSTSAGITPTFTKVINTTVTRVSGADTISTTSTSQTAYSTFGNGEHFIFQSNTTTNSGMCVLSVL